MKAVRKINFTLALSVITFVIVVAIACLWIFKSKEVAVVTLDTFVGIIVALLAVIVTVAIGWQIYNSMELKSNINKVQSNINYLNKEIEKIESIREELELQKEHINDVYHQSHHFSHIAIADNYYKEKKYIVAYLFYHSALYATVQTVKQHNKHIVINSLQKCVAQMSNNEKIEQKRFDKLFKHHLVITESKPYDEIRDLYESVYSSFVSKINVIKNDDQK